MCPPDRCFAVCPKAISPDPRVLRVSEGTGSGRTKVGTYRSCGTWPNKAINVSKEIAPTASARSLAMPIQEERGPRLGSGRIAAEFRNLDSAFSRSRGSIALTELGKPNPIGYFTNCQVIT